MPRLVRRTCFVVSLLAPLGPAMAQGRPLAIEDYYRLKTVGAPQISPDGKRVAFTVATRIESTNADSVEVWAAPTDGSAPAKRESPAGQNATAPRWSGVQLSWTVVGAGPGGGFPSTITSPDGKWVAVVRNMIVQKRARASASDFERRHEERFRGREFDWLDFQRDGQNYPVPNRLDPEVSPPQEVFIAEAGADQGPSGPSGASGVGGSGGAAASASEPVEPAWRQLTRIALRPAGLEWNAASDLLVYTADSSYRDELKYGSDEIYVVGRDARPRRITPNNDFDYAGPHFSPDGKWVLATRQLSTDVVIAKHMDNGGATDLVLVPVNGGEEKNLTADWDYLPTGARWSPDGKYVYFSGGVGGTTHLFRVSPNGGAVEQVTKGERRVNGISFDKSMTRMAYTVGLTDAPAEVYAASIDGSGERKLTSIHSEFLGRVTPSKSDRLQFNSKDGTSIEGWLMYPAGFRRDGGPYPLVVINHGGPHSADGYAFDFKQQYFAANGYFVLMVNFRSSTGYGEKFLWGTWGAWGDRDGEDVIAGLDYVLARQPIDRRRVAVMGHSYGGFMTNWLMTQYPDRWAAAIPGAGIVNWVSDYGTADIARTKETEFYGTPWDEKGRNIMIRQSPLTYANRAKAPTLFINGEIDQRVPYSEAEQMYVALKKNGVPAKVIQYQGMPHSISGSWNVVHRMLNERRWLDTYLKPASP